MKLFLYGSSDARNQAWIILENLPQVKRMDALNGNAEMRLILDETINESSLIPLLKPSGISGFRLLD